MRSCSEVSSNELMLTVVTTLPMKMFWNVTPYLLDIPCILGTAVAQLLRRCATNWKVDIKYICIPTSALNINNTL